MMQRQIYTRISHKVNDNFKAFCVSRRFFCSNKDEADNREKVTNRRRFLKQSQGLHAYRPEECPEKPTIVLFPGQGAQFVGMAKSLVDIPEARDLFDIASEILRLYR